MFHVDEGLAVQELQSCGGSHHRSQPPLARISSRCRMTMPTILIIDDEESVRALLRFALEAAGYEVTEAANGRQGPTDLVIVDMLMP